MDLSCIIEEAKCCSAHIAHSFAKKAIFGNETEEDYYALLRINAYIRTLERNTGTIKRYKEKVSLNSGEISMSMLKRKNNLLFLDSNDKYVCITKKIDPCLPDSDLRLIIEEIRLLCAQCNCNC